MPGAPAFLSRGPSARKGGPEGVQWEGIASRSPRLLTTPSKLELTRGSPRTWGLTCRNQSQGLRGADSRLLTCPWQDLRVVIPGVGTLGVLPQAIWQQLTDCEAPGIPNAEEAARRRLWVQREVVGHLPRQTPTEQNGQGSPVKSAPSVSAPLNVSASGLRPRALPSQLCPPSVPP